MRLTLPWTCASTAFSTALTASTLPFNAPSGRMSTAPIGCAGWQANTRTRRETQRERCWAWAAGARRPVPQRGSTSSTSRQRANVKGQASCSCKLWSVTRDSGAWFGCKRKPACTSSPCFSAKVSACWNTGSPDQTTTCRVHGWKRSCREFRVGVAWAPRISDI